MAAVVVGEAELDAAEVAGGGGRGREADVDKPEQPGERE